jgi:hypothetical protein
VVQKNGMPTVAQCDYSHIKANSKELRDGLWRFLLLNIRSNIWGTRNLFFFSLALCRGSVMSIHNGRIICTSFCNEDCHSSVTANVTAATPAHGIDWDQQWMSEKKVLKYSPYKDILYHTSNCQIQKIHVPKAAVAIDFHYYRISWS